MEPTKITRAVYAGGSCLDASKIEAYALTPLDINSLHTLDVADIQQYYAGCHIHKDCDGHICATPRGMLILPHKFTALVGPIENTYGKLARQLMINDNSSSYADYLHEIRQTLMSKYGVLRGEMMGTSVDGSARMVIIPCWEIKKNEVALPRHTAAKLKYPYIQTVKIGDEDVESEIYGLKTVEAGDYALVIRAPSLEYTNTQPMRVVLWDHPAIGLHPANCAEYHADFDGDEMQVYPIGSKASIEEAEAWISNAGSWPSLDGVREWLPEEYQNPHDWDLESQTQSFMQHSTYSMREIRQGIATNPLLKMSRMKEDTTNMTTNMMNTPPDIETFYAESSRGMMDIMAQQLTQGSVGQLSRHARIGASCFSGVQNGSMYVASNEGRKLLGRDIEVDNTLGNPTIRAISKFAAMAQQSALDSHRANTSNIKRFDIVRHLMGDTDEILVLTHGKNSFGALWSMPAGDAHVSIYPPNASIDVQNIIGCCSPTVLADIHNEDHRREVCARGLMFISSYLGATLDTQQIMSLVEAICYQCDSDKRPIFSQSGMLSKDVRWLCKVVNSHYGKLKDLIIAGHTTQVLSPMTVAECRAFCNFDALRKPRTPTAIGFCGRGYLSPDGQLQAKIAMCDILARHPERIILTERNGCVNIRRGTSNTQYPTCIGHGINSDQLCVSVVVWQYYWQHGVDVEFFDGAELSAVGDVVSEMHMYARPWVQTVELNCAVIRHEVL